MKMQLVLLGCLAVAAVSSPISNSISAPGIRVQGSLLEQGRMRKLSLRSNDDQNFLNKAELARKSGEESGEKDSKESGEKDSKESGEKDSKESGEKDSKENDKDGNGKTVENFDEDSEEDGKTTETGTEKVFGIGDFGTDKDTSNTKENGSDGGGSGGGKGKSGKDSNNKGGKGKNSDENDRDGSGSGCGCRGHGGRGKSGEDSDSDGGNAGGNKLVNLGVDLTVYSPCS